MFCVKHREKEHDKEYELCASFYYLFIFFLIYGNITKSNFVSNICNQSWYVLLFELKQISISCFLQVSIKIVIIIYCIVQQKPFISIV